MCTENNPTFAVSAYTLKYFPHRLTEEYEERTFNFQQCLGSEKIELRGYILAYDDKGAMLVHPRPMCARPKILGCCTPWTKCPLAILPLTKPSYPFDLIERSDTRLPSGGVLCVG